MKYILINTPDITHPAGVSNHYFGLRSHFSNRVIYNEYKTKDCIKYDFPNFSVSQALIFSYSLKVKDAIKFIYLILKYKRPIIVLNPSFNRSALKRDIFFLKLAKLLQCKVVVFLHGWNNDYYNEILNKNFALSDAWKNADAFMVLSKQFKNNLHFLGITCPVFLTTTKVANKLVENFAYRKKEHFFRVLFLARVIKQKGIYTAIDSFALVQKKYNYVQLKVVGIGDELEQAIAYAEAKGILGIDFTGALFANDLRDAYVSSDIYILPTTHAEGMPTTVLEAMAFGLPILTTPVGGLNDFFEEARMGYFIDALDARSYADKIIEFIENPQVANSISEFNYSYSHQNFLGSEVARDLEHKILSIY